jgi:hypothetical protein
MKSRKIGNTEIPEIGLGCMNLSHGYGGYPGKEDSFALLQRAYDLGVRHYDTAALYGFGRNEELVGEWMQPYRKEIHLASKCGMQGVNSKRVIDGRTATLKATLEDSLRRLNTDFIDLYYLHRWDKNNVAIEESVGALAEMVQEGKIGGIGLSEVSAATLRKAHAVYPITAVQNEYSLWTRNPEIGLSAACQELGVTLVAFSPLARGFLCAVGLDPTTFEEGDIRSTMPRFQEPYLSYNRELLKQFSQICSEADCTLAQTLLAWVLAQGEHVLPIPGTAKIHHLEEDLSAASITLPAEILSKLDDLFQPEKIHGLRYPSLGMYEVDTERFVCEQ